MAKFFAKSRALTLRFALSFGGLFSGALITEAKARGKWAHMGRVNSLRKLRAAASMGCDSADGTFIAYAPEQNVARIAVWLRNFAREPMFALAH